MHCLACHEGICSDTVYINKRNNSWDFQCFHVDHFFCLAFSSFQASLVVVVVVLFVCFILLQLVYLGECADQAFQQAVFVSQCLVFLT